MNWLLEVTDLKQYLYCPRIVYYRYCLPQIRPVTYLMEEGTRHHEEEEKREERRNLHHYSLTEGERITHLALRSSTLCLSGRLDLAIATPSRSDPDAKAIVVEYKYSEHKAGAHWILQLAAYALLLEEAWHIPVIRAYLYALPLKQAEAVAITAHQRKKVLQVVQQIQHMINGESMPAPPHSQARCITCEFRRFCHDVL